MTSSQDIVFISGIFNILHPGHFRILEFARSLGNKLIVGVIQTDNHTDDALSIDERVKNLSALIFVDEVRVVDGPISDMLVEIKPRIIVKGNEFRHKIIEEELLLEPWGGKVVCFSGEMTESRLSAVTSNSVDIISNNFHEPFGFIARHKIDKKWLASKISGFRDLKISVFGDVIVDTYTNCQGIGMSREDTSLAVRKIDQKSFVGGAGIVALHAAGLGAQVTLFCSVGNDDAGNFCKETLSGAGLSLRSFEDEFRPTVVKNRFRASGKTLLRLNDYSDKQIPDEGAEYLTKEFGKISGNNDLMIFSDFSYGTLTKEGIADLILAGDESGIKMAADSQSSSQIGNILKFKGVDMITPTEYEARLATNDFTGGLNTVASALMKLTTCGSAFITQGKDGVLVLSRDQGGIKIDHLPAFSDNPVDTAGAGDAFLVGASMSSAIGLTIWESALVGSLMAGIQVSRMGNSGIKLDELERALLI